jgi:hypothetical protein
MAFYDSAGRANYFIEFGAGRPVLLLHGNRRGWRAAPDDDERYVYAMVMPHERMRPA